MPCTTGTPDSIQRRIKAVRRLPRVTTSGLMPTPDLRGNRQPFTTGENFSPTRYTVENGFYFIDQKPHKGRLAVRDVKALPGQRR